MAVFCCQQAYPFFSPYNDRVRPSTMTRDDPLSQRSPSPAAPSASSILMTKKTQQERNASIFAPTTIAMSTDVPEYELCKVGRLQCVCLCVFGVLHVFFCRFSVCSCSRSRRWKYISSSHTLSPLQRFKDLLQRMHTESLVRSGIASHYSMLVAEAGLKGAVWDNVMIFLENACTIRICQKTSAYVGFFSLRC